MDTALCNGSVFCTHPAVHDIQPAHPAMWFRSHLYTIDLPRREVVGVIHQQVHLACVIAAADAVYVPQIGPIHPDQEVVFVVVGVGDLSRSFPSAVDAKLHQLVSRRGMDRSAGFLGAGSRRFDVELGFWFGFLHQIFHHKLGHRVAVNVAVVDEENSRHYLHTSSCCFLQYSTLLPASRGLSPNERRM